MNNITKMKIVAKVDAVFEAFVDPANMSHYWFSSGSGRLEPGKTVTLRYEEYNAEVEIQVQEVVENQKIVYRWGETVVTITMNEAENESTIVEVTEAGFKENDPDLLGKMLDNKEGWVYMLTCLKAYLEFGVNLRGALVK